MTPLTQVLSPVQPVFPPALGSFSYVLMFFAAHFSSQNVSVPIMHSNSFVLPPKGLSFQYLPYSTLFSLISFLPSLILYKYPWVLPTFLPKFLFSVSVLVLMLPNFQTPSDLDQPKIPKVPVSPQPPKNWPRPPARFSFDDRQSCPQKCHQEKPRLKDKPSVTDIKAAWSTGIYPYSLVEHATAPRRECIWIQSLCNCPVSRTPHPLHATSLKLHASSSNNQTASPPKAPVINNSKYFSPTLISPHLSHYQAKPTTSAVCLPMPPWMPPIFDLDNFPPFTKESHLPERRESKKHGHEESNR